MPYKEVKGIGSTSLFSCKEWDELTDKQRDELKEYFPEEGERILEQQDIVVFDVMDRILRKGVVYHGYDIFYTLRFYGINHLLHGIGCHSMNLYGNRKTQTLLVIILDHLWRHRMIRKFARGVFNRSGRLYGVHWVLKEKDG